MSDLLSELDSAQRAERNRKFVYFVQAEEGKIKIGISGDVTRRIKQLQHSAGSKLTVLGVMRGGRKSESILHEHFSANRLVGEWFSPSPELLDLIRLCTISLETGLRITAELTFTASESALLSDLHNRAKEAMYLSKLIERHRALLQRGVGK